MKFWPIPLFSLWRRRKVKRSVTWSTMKLVLATDQKPLIYVLSQDCLQLSQVPQRLLPSDNHHSCILFRDTWVKLILISNSTCLAMSNVHIELIRVIICYIFHIYFLDVLIHGKKVATFGITLNFDDTEMSGLFTWSPTC